MSSRHFLFVVGARVFSPKIAVGAEFANHCADLATLRAAIKGQDGKLIKITSDQWQFLRGVYAMNVEAPPGLPDGDNAVLAQGGGDSNDQLFFVDRDEPWACRRGVRVRPGPGGDAVAGRTGRPTTAAGHWGTQSYQRRSRH
jgi:hypothetical protein